MERTDNGMPRVVALRASTCDVARMTGTVHLPTHLQLDAHVHAYLRSHDQLRA